MKRRTSLLHSVTATLLVVLRLLQLATERITIWYQKTNLTTALHSSTSWKVCYFTQRQGQDFLKHGGHDDNIKLKSWLVFIEATLHILLFPVSDRLRTRKCCWYTLYHWSLILFPARQRAAGGTTQNGLHATGSGPARLNLTHFLSCSHTKTVITIMQHTCSDG